MFTDRFSVVCHFRNDLSRLKWRSWSGGNTVVNFTNILWAKLWCQNSFVKNLKSQTGIREKQCKTLLYEKVARKTLTKLSPGRPPPQPQCAHHIGNIKNKGSPLLKITSTNGSTGSASTNWLTGSISVDGSIGSVSTNGLIGSTSINRSTRSMPIRVCVHFVFFERKKKKCFCLLFIFFLFECKFRKELKWWRYNKQLHAKHPAIEMWWQSEVYKKITRHVYPIVW